MCWIDADRKLVQESDLLNWICEKHIQIFGYNPTKTIHIRSGFLSNNKLCSEKYSTFYILSIQHAVCVDCQEKIFYLRAEDVLNKWQIYISQNDYEQFLAQSQQQEKERTDTMNNIQIQKANYIVQVQYPKGNYNDEKWSPSNFTSTLSSLSKDEFYEKVYNYAVPNGMSLKKGDYVLVGRSDNTMAVVKVVGIVEDSLKNMEEINKATNYVYGKVNLDAIIKQIGQAERAKYLKNKIDELKKTFEERKMLEIMAQNDPEAAKIIEEYKQLTLPLLNNK